MKITKYDIFISYIYRIKDFIPNIPSYIIQGIKNLIYYFPIIWNDRDWDHYFFHKLLRHKLNSMEKYFRHADIIMDSKKYADKIKICVNLLDRILKDEYHDIVFKNHDKKWGKIDISFKSVKDKPEYNELIITRKKVKPEDEEQERKEFNILVKKEHELELQDIEMLYKILNENILKWWD